MFSFVDFGVEFVDVRNHEFVSKRYGVVINTELHWLRRRDNKPENREFFQRLKHILNGFTYSHLENGECSEFFVHDFPTFIIDYDDPVVLNYSKIIPFEQLFIVHPENGKIETNQTSADEHFQALISASTESRCKQIRDTISEKLDGKVFSSAIIKVGDEFKCDVLIENAFEFMGQYYKIVERVKRALIESI